MPSWFSAALTLADFVAQRVDQVGPISFEPIGDQPPERAGTPPYHPSRQSPAGEEAPRAEPDGRPNGPDDGSDRSAENAIGFEAPQAAGGIDPSTGGGDGGDTGPDEDDDSGSTPRCSFRTPRASDPSTTYEA